MTSPQPSSTVVRDRRWQLAFGGTLVVVLFGFVGVLKELFTLWTTNIDYSHGLLIVPFMGYLLWTRRDSFPAVIRKWPDAVGVPFVVVGAVIYLVEERVNFAKEWMQAFAMMIALAGVILMYCGRWAGLKWAAPALAFLPLAFKLPDRIEVPLMFKLRGFATEWGNYAFQALGYPSYTEGNIIIIGDTKLGVEQACSGLSMVLAFIALGAAIAVLYRSRPLIDRVIIFAAAAPIAIFCNIVRIIVTGLCYHAGWTKLADAVVHDLAGWLMMPMALAMLWVVVKLMDWVVEPVDRVSMNEALGIPKIQKTVLLTKAESMPGSVRPT